MSKRQTLEDRLAVSPFRRKLSLRIRITLCCALLLVTGATGLVIATNVLAEAERPRTTFAVPAVRLNPNTPLGDQPYAPAITTDRTEPSAGVAASKDLIESIEAATLQRVRVISFAILAVTAVLGTSAAYWLAGTGLLPVRAMSAAVQRIDAGSLGFRLEREGPDDELGRLSGAFNSMLARLEDAFAQQSRFVADAAHELRTPFATLRTALEVVRADDDATITDYAEMAKTLKRSLSRLENLVANMLVLADRGQVSLDQDVSLEPFVEEILADLAPMAEGRGVTLSLSCADEVIIRGNATYLSLALRNLVENAIRYNHAGGRVEIEISLAGDSTVVAVIDTGIGISESEQAQIFEPFYRTDSSRSRDSGGYGLGLSIVAKAVQLHKGCVSVESFPDQGSTFTMQLPLHNACNAETEEKLNELPKRGPRELTPPL